MTTRRAHFVLVVAAAVVVAACGAGARSPGASTASTASTPTASAPLWGPPGTTALPTVYQESLQRSLDGWVDQVVRIGATAAVVTPAGVWSGAAGVDGAGKTLVPDSAMWVASVTKTFTAAEVMLLASRGLVDLDKPLSSYVDAPFDTKGATVRQALAMRSGFPEYPDTPGGPSRNWTASQILGRLPADAPRLGDLGGTPRYNNLNYLLLGELIEKVTHRSMAQAFRTDLLDPAGLHRTWVQTAETPTAPLTVGTNPPGADLVDPAGPWLPSRASASMSLGGGCIAGDAADLARWGYLLYGGRVIDSSLVKQMQADPQPDPDKGMYALGTMVVQEGARMVGHAGGGPEWPYTAVMLTWTGTPPVAVVVLTPQPADFGKVYNMVLNLHQDVANIPATASPSTN